MKFKLSLVLVVSVLAFPLLGLGQDFESLMPPAPPTPAPISLSWGATYPLDSFPDLW
jgi:hypothetical protein